MLPVHHANHSQSAVESFQHFVRVQVGFVADPGEKRRNCPGARVQLGAQVTWQAPWNVLEQAAACDVRQCLDQARLDGRHELLDVNLGGLEKALGQAGARVAS